MTEIQQPIVIYYSKTGHSQRVAEAFSRLSGAKIQHLETSRYQVPVLWMFRGILDVARKVAPPLSQCETDKLQSHRWAVVCGPVWAAMPAPPLRSLLWNLSDSHTPVGLILTAGRTGKSKKATEECEAILGRKLIASCTIENPITGTNEMSRRLQELHTKMRRASDGEEA